MDRLRCASARRRQCEQTDRDCCRRGCHNILRWWPNSGWCAREAHRSACGKSVESIVVRLLFAHDHTFYVETAGAVFSPGRLPYTVWQRYLNAFSELEVLARARPVASGLASLTKSSGPNVSFTFDHGLRAA